MKKETEKMLDFLRLKFGEQDTRILDIDGVAWWVTRDLLMGILGHAQSTMTRKLKDIPEFAKGYAKVPTPGGEQSVPIITTGAALDLISSSRSKHAEELKRWMIYDATASIIERGMYTLPGGQPVIEGVPPPKNTLPPKPLPLLSERAREAIARENRLAEKEKRIAAVELAKLEVRKLKATQDAAVVAWKERDISAEALLTAIERAKGVAELPDPYIAQCQIQAEEIRSGRSMGSLRGMVERYAPVPHGFVVPEGPPLWRTQPPYTKDPPPLGAETIDMIADRHQVHIKEVAAVAAALHVQGAYRMAAAQEGLPERILMDRDQVTLINNGLLRLRRGLPLEPVTVTAGKAGITGPRNN